MRRHFGARLLPLAVLGVVLSACMPLYLPPVPDPPPFEAGTRVVAFTAELNAAGRPSLELTLADLHAHDDGLFACRFQTDEITSAKVARLVAWILADQQAAASVHRADPVGIYHA